ncbi:hypothetical protein CUU95_12590 [Vreelandella alkaliphila]|uniref:hypothetical protein n=1 Tax=Vreelandella alkaliphila TaxID=272774 RepID=UPI000EA39F6D|nr:hypothetical protein [Halomonas alkaliphila]AYF34591.1 hypothetical protein CUU95_12590 [Halomonas alkaliphila]
MSENITSLTQQINDCNAHLKSHEQALADIQTRQQAVVEAVETLRQTLAGLEAKVAEFAGEDAALASPAEQAPVLLISEEPYPEQRLAGFVPLKVLAEERERLAPFVQTVRDSELFDAAWYLEQYPDLKDSDYAEDPAMHYLLFGGFEGRHPGPSFNSIAYYLEYPDVYQNQLNPLLHFLVNGIKEGRTAYPVAKQ